jgi:hypothetical protein
MRATRWPASRSRVFVVLVGALLVWSSVTSIVAAAADKSFSASLSPNALVAGASYGSGTRASITLTITNTSNQAQLGSANATLPLGLKLTGASPTATATANLATNTVELRNLSLQPGASFAASVAAQVECAANHPNYEWTFEVKQANDFNGTPGNNLQQDAPVASTISGQCGLSFTKQPKSAEKNVTITNRIYDVGVPQAGDPVTVSVGDAEGVFVSWWSGSITMALGANPGSATAGGSLSGSTTTGSVTFTPQLNVSATGYTLSATAVGTVGTPSAGTSGSPFVSDAFAIVDDATICASGSATCSVTASGPNRGNGVKTQATVTAGTGGQANDLVILSVADPATDFNCGTYVATTDIIAFNATLPDGVTPVGRTKTTQLKLLVAYVTQSASKYDVCYRSSASAPFTPKGGGAQVTQGLLPNCAAKDPVAPCVVLRETTRTKDVLITVLSPAGDPGMKF